MTDNDDDNAPAGDAGVRATVPNAIALDDIALIGVLTGSEPAALLRAGNGQVKRLGLGDRAFGLRVAGIGDGQVLLSDRRGRTYALDLPRG